MRNNRTATLIASIAITLLASSASILASEKTDTFQGTLVSASCYLGDHSRTGNDMGVKGCGSGCLKQGKPGGLLTKDNGFYILDAPSLLLAPYVGQEIRVTGYERAKGVISVSTASVRKGGGWEGINLSALIPK